MTRLTLYWEQCLFFRVVRLKTNIYLTTVGADGRILPNFILNKCAVRMRIGINSLSIIKKEVFCELGNECTASVFFQWLFQPIRGPGLLFSSLIIFIDSRTPWTSDQPVARPLPKHRATQSQNKRIHTPNVHALSRIRTHDPSVRASEDSSWLRPRGYSDRHSFRIGKEIFWPDKWLYLIEILLSECPVRTIANRGPEQVRHTALFTHTVASVSQRRPQWPRGLTHELSPSAWTLRSWVRIPLKAWMSVCVYSVFVCCPVCR
jgi:hypothetical protein